MSEKVEAKAGSGNQPARPTKRVSARERIFETACDLFYRKGIRAVGVETIAEEAHTTKMSLYRSFPSKDELVAEWLRQHDATFWQQWETLLKQRPNDPRGQLTLLFATVAEHVADPTSRGCPMVNVAVELTDPNHPARKIIAEHKARLRACLVQMCTELAVSEPAALADGLFLLLEGAQASTQSLGPSGPACSVARVAETLIEAHWQKTIDGSSGGLR